MKTSGHLNLLFAQWQGGKRRAVQEGAVKFAAALGDTVALNKIIIDSVEELMLVKNIHGYQVVVEQFLQAFDMIACHNPETISVIGGDCSVSLAPIAYLNNRYEGNLAVLWLDAHGDLNSPEGSLTKAFHGMPLRFLLGEGDAAIIDKVATRLTPRQILLAGVRELDAAESQFIRQSDICLIGPEALAASPQQPATIFMDKGYDNVYIHLDTDVLSSNDFAFCAYPTSGGISLANLFDIIRDVKNHFNIVGFSLTEFLPCDSDGAAKLCSIVKSASPKLFND